MIRWYCRVGNGMLLPEPTSSVYLNAKKNLVCDERDLVPCHVLRLLPAEMPPDDKRGCMSIRQLSLLRTQMKSDLTIYGLPYSIELSRADRDFLLASNVKLTSRTWKPAFTSPPRAERCGEPDPKCGGQGDNRKVGGTQPAL